MKVAGYALALGFADILEASIRGRTLPLCLTSTSVPSLRATDTSPRQRPFSSSSRRIASRASSPRLVNATSLTCRPKTSPALQP